jgi:ribosomal protein L11 methyltransferase
MVRRKTLDLDQRFLDIGTGSGILAIGAARVGYRIVHAFDFDPEALRVARANARENGVLRRIRFWQEDITRAPRRSAAGYDVVCANLISNLLLSEADRIIAQMKPGGVLVLAGILRSEFGEIVRAYREAGLRLVASRSEKEWRSGTFAAAEPA